MAEKNRLKWSESYLSQPKPTIVEGENMPFNFNFILIADYLSTCLLSTLTQIKKMSPIRKE